MATAVPNPSPVRQIVAVEHSDASHRPAVPIHIPAFCKLDIVLRGKVTLFTTEGQRVELRPGLGVLVPPLTPHGYESRGQLMHMAVKFHLHPRYRFHVGKQALLIDVPSYVQEVAHECGKHALSADPATAPLVQAAATYCAVFALRQATPQLLDDPPHDMARDALAQAIHHVTLAPTQPWTVSQLAEMHHLSESQFTKRFHRAYGQSPQQFLQETRMIAAADLLISTDWSVKRIAETCGYANVHGLTRAFTRVIGTPPATYRRRMQLTVG